jgi:hypothetical protein
MGVLPARGFAGLTPRPVMPSPAKAAPMNALRCIEVARWWIISFSSFRQVLIEIHIML